MVVPFHICGVISLVAAADKKGLKALKNFYTNRKKLLRQQELRTLNSFCLLTMNLFCWVICRSRSEYCRKNIPLFFSFANLNSLVFKE
jgi:exoribonuclease II